MINLKLNVQDLYERKFMTDKAREMDIPEQYLIKDHFPNYFQLFIETREKARIKWGDPTHPCIGDILKRPHDTMCERFGIDDMQFAEFLTYYEMNFPHHIEQIKEAYND